MNPAKVNNEIAQVMEVVIQELKNPLTSIAFNIESMKRLLNGEDTIELLRQKLERVEARANQMSCFLEHFLDLGHCQLKGLDFKKNIINTHELLSDIIASLKKQTFISLIDIQMDQEVVSEFCAVECDKERMIQVFLNVITHLVNEESSPKYIKLHTKINGMYAQFSIKTEGAPLEDRIVTGIHHSLGFLLSERILEAHQGRIWWEDQDICGMHLRIDLPKKNMSSLLS